MSFDLNLMRPRKTPPGGSKICLPTFATMRSSKRRDTRGIDRRVLVLTEEIASKPNQESTLFLAVYAGGMEGKLMDVCRQSVS